MFLCGFEEKRPLLSAKPLWRVSIHIPLAEGICKPLVAGNPKNSTQKEKVDFLMPYPATLISFSSPTWQP